jgi:hypothetical protein
MAGSTLFLQSADVISGEGSVTGDATVAIPSNKRLIIECISIDGAAPQGQRLSASVQVSDSGAADVAFNIVPSFLGTFNPGSGAIERIVGMQQARLHSVNQLHLHIFRSASTGQARVNFAISGYLEDA